MISDDEHVFPLPFGRYRGYCAKCVAENDPQYVRWCLAQDGLADSYPEVCHYWVAQGFAPMPRCAANLKTTGEMCPNRARDGEMFCGTHLRYVCTYSGCMAKAETGQLCREHFDTELYALLG